MFRKCVIHLFFSICFLTFVNSFLIGFLYYRLFDITILGKGILFLAFVYCLILAFFTVKLLINVFDKIKSNKATYYSQRLICLCCCCFMLYSNSDLFLLMVSCLSFFVFFLFQFLLKRDSSLKLFEKPDVLYKYSLKNIMRRRPLHKDQN